MNTITKEFAQDIIRGQGYGVAPSAVEALARIALASLEAEPVAWRYRHHNGLAPSNWKFVDSEDECNVAPNYQRQALYVTQPAPVSVPTFEEWCERTHQNPLGWVRDAMKETYDGCRAAMLQSFGDSGWVACSERIPEQFVEVLACTEDGGRYIAALNQRMTWDDGDFFDDIQDVTHWQLLPSPPAK